MGGYVFLKVVKPLRNKKGRKMFHLYQIPIMVSFSELPAVKFSFSEKVTKIWKNLPLALMLLSKNNCFGATTKNSRPSYFVTPLVQLNLVIRNFLVVAKSSTIARLFTIYEAKWQNGSLLPSCSLSSRSVLPILAV